MSEFCCKFCPKLCSRPIALLCLPLAVALSGCTGLIWGNLAMLAIAVGIFMGTLSLGRE